MISCDFSYNSFDVEDSLTIQQLLKKNKDQYDQNLISNQQYKIVKRKVVTISDEKFNRVDAKDL